jgi:hypothetical protein
MAKIPPKKVRISVPAQVLAHLSGVPPPHARIGSIPGEAICLETELAGKKIGGELGSSGSVVGLPAEPAQPTKLAGKTQAVVVSPTTQDLRLILDGQGEVAG